MIKKIIKQISNFKNDIDDIETKNANVDINSILTIIKEEIKENTKRYFETDNPELKETLKSNLIRCYNLLYYYQAKLKGLRRAYMVDEELAKLPDIYLVDQKPERFEINESLLREINVSEGLTMEQALELLKWSVNNTRDNLNISETIRSGLPGDVYGNSSLGGACGFSQFSTLYPLQQLGLEITINNVRSINGGSHAYGTVVIPIKTDGEIIKKRFLLDCTYRQFFTIPWNVVARYLDTKPFIGFLIYQDEEEIGFSKELLKNGFVEANSENMEKYLRPFFCSNIPINDLNETAKKFSEFSNLDIIEILEKNQEEFDYSEEEFIKWGLNLDLVSNKNKKL